MISKSEIEQILFEKLLQNQHIPFEFQLDFMAEIMEEILLEQKDRENKALKNVLVSVRNCSLDSNVKESARLLKIYTDTSLALIKHPKEGGKKHC